MLISRDPTGGREPGAYLGKSVPGRRNMDQKTEGLGQVKTPRISYSLLWLGCFSWICTPQIAASLYLTSRVVRKLILTFFGQFPHYLYGGEFSDVFTLLFSLTLFTSTVSWNVGKLGFYFTFFNSLIFPSILFIVKYAVKHVNRSSWLTGQGDILQNYINKLILIICIVLCLHLDFYSSEIYFGYNVK